MNHIFSNGTYYDEMAAWNEKWIVRLPAICLSVILFSALILAGLKIGFPRPYFYTVSESGLDVSLVYSVMKAESGFREDAKSRAGAVGLMQLMPSTAAFICELENVDFSMEKLTCGEYNVTIGCLYLRYLLNKFSVAKTAVAAYNAGEGVVQTWLNNGAYSSDGVHLNVIPYPETSRYVKKIFKFQKIYRFLYH